MLPPHILSVSSAAYTKARQKIRHTAFIELNEKAVVELTYAHPHATYHGRRLFAVDGSKIRLPDTDENKEIFGVATYANQKKHVKGEHAFAMASVLYDVLNNVAVNAVLERSDKAEIDVATHHWKYLKRGDIVVLDRGYGAYRTMAQITATGADFVIRCSSASFLIANQMLQGIGADSITTTVKAPIKILREHQDSPPELALRFVRVILPTGESEVVATSLRDEQTYPTDSFKKLYGYRWGIETFYGIIKTRLCLENFTGLSVEAVRQDFFATIFLSSLESLLTEESDEQLKQKQARYAQQVNNAVSFHAIKHKAFDLLLSTKHPDQIVQELTALFLTNPTLYRPDKKALRKKSVTRRIVNYFKYKRKIMF